jgi:hypothetical protein
MGMTPDQLKARTKKFAVETIRFAKAIPKDHINDEIASQLTDAATSTAVHYRAVCCARSRADFINKLSRGDRGGRRGCLMARSPDGIRHLDACINAVIVARSRRADSDLRAVARDGARESRSRAPH